jgi:hypothetical protein
MKLGKETVRNLKIEFIQLTIGGRHWMLYLRRNIWIDC